MRKIKMLIGLWFFFLLIQEVQAQSKDFPVLVWEEDFNSGKQPSKAFWNYEIGKGQNGWGNKEKQYYTGRPDNVRIENGHLIIRAQKEAYMGSKYTSARITTQGKKEFKYARVEVRAKLPGGKGLWPAIWMLGSNFKEVGWPACGEIDIMEYVGFNPGVVHATMHTPSSHGASKNSKKIKIRDAENAFHVYSMEKTDKEIKFYVDDQLFYTYSPKVKDSSTWPYEQNNFLILNVAVGGNWGGKKGIDDRIFPQQMEVDYVRVYQKQ
ncbi:glycoside hydrolase family 16 protein [Xanthovirga aplysinae]|uniref:glycoside hydrolase family 16 protein n=1 Tax=Xanthovirga aplysinae TaxID=2529853 RepID=UPI0012BD1F36|nr:glycoside hydrolase family 16 protein [Xanthovirga aplysinae]MTI33185.1 glycoside hydrolase family 16 protein [Xanthovirga aplysinae]